MLYFADMTCDACGKAFNDTQQFAQFYCDQCDKHFTLCPDCRKDFACDYCGSRKMLDIYQHHKKKYGTDIIF